MILQWVFSPVCLHCNKVVSQTGLCPECWSKLEFIGSIHCTKCCKPYICDYKIVCNACINTQYSFTQLRSVLKYNAIAKTLILKFKNEAHLYLRNLFTKWLYIAGQDIFESVDYIIYVPVHTLKLLWRGYNQTELLAQSLSVLINKPCIPLVNKERYTYSQSYYTKEERHKNIQNSFGLSQHIQIAFNKTILLIDDVTTTKATLNAISKLVQEKYHAKIICLTIAQT